MANNTTLYLNSNNLSDYNTPSTDLFELLPQPYRSDTNRAIMSNLFNRYLSKNQTVEVIGYIGDGNPAAIRTRQIVEPTVGRQAYQLQPLLYEKIGSIEYITSWQDILDEVAAQGVDTNDLPIWGNATIFNWAPPIDISKIVNYTDYYWVDNNNPTSQPSYLTVKNDEQIVQGWDINGWDTTPWDSETETGLPTIPTLQQWIGTNNWVYKADVTDAQWAIARRAQAPIIEFEPELELNEWTYTTYSWQYRSDTVSSFVATTKQPNRFELEPLSLYTLSPSRQIITLDERYGDLTNVFVPGYSFSIAKSVAGGQTVASSSYVRSSLPSGAFQTQITLTQPIPLSVTIVPAVNFLQPEVTSIGDPWAGYGQQWLFVGINTTTAINHQAQNNMVTPDPASYVVDSSGNYGTTFAPYAAQYTILKNNVTTLTFSATYFPAGSSRNLQMRALVGANDIRVYINGIRQYGTYDENGSLYVTGITFTEPLAQQDVVLIQVGEAAYSDFGNYAIPVRTIADNATYLADGPVTVSLIQYRLNEQTKSATNQYPLFDIYLTNSQSANIANEIFGYHDSPTGVLYPYLGQRVVTRADGSLEFQNFLVQTNNGMMYAYRNYNNLTNLYWFNPNTQQLLVWDNTTWATKYENTVGVYGTPIVTTVLPDPSTTPLGTLVFNTTNNTLYVRSNVPTFWSTLPVTISTTDETLQTIWRKGLHNEQAVPARVDWLRRTYPEYQAEYTAYIAATVTALQQANPSLTTAEATTQANTSWTAMQDNYIQPEWYTDPNAVREGPLWVGEWQIPDPMYYNVSHWDYQYVSTRDLYTHFESIIDAQPLLPAANGNPTYNWTLIDYTQINWGLGGTIHEYDNSFDTFLSAEFINTVTPPSLFRFAQSEYENTIVTLNQIFQRNAVNYLTATDTATIENPGATIAKEVITVYEENEQADLVYGDSTTYQEATLTTPSNGIKNWIATLPYFKILEKTPPYANIDPATGLQEIVHHDGHRASYVIQQSIINALQIEIVNTTDPRFPLEKIGRISTNSAPATTAQFISVFSPNVRLGVYWLVSTTNTLYRLTNITGTILTWTLVSLNAILIDIILAAEQLLFNQAPAPGPLKLSYAAIEATDPTQWGQLMQQQFNNYIAEAQITTPYANSMFNAANPFTWNYKYSTTTKEPRSGTVLSGGTWQDVYQKAYGTPYPNLEPWILQGYPSKPIWWDATFLNNNTAVYGTRKWKYAHSLPVISVTTTTITVGPQFANQTAMFTDFGQFTVYTGSGIFTYNVSTTVPPLFAAGYTTVTTTTPIDASIVAGASIAIGMWDYIVRGAIVNGNPAPPVMPPVYSYVSVNISGYTFTDGILTYNPDDVFAPYWNVFAHEPPLSTNPLSQDRYVRSIFTDTTFEVQSENADYVWNDQGPVQWAWSQSTFYEYSELIVSYLMQPVRTIQQTFGINFEYIDGLPIDALTGQVFSHENTQFHGEISLTNQVIRVNGINQWYVNYNRANGYDTSYSDFRAMWTGWTAPLSHLFAATIDTSSFGIDHRVIEITPADYELTMKRSPGVSNSWIDAFNVRIQSIPSITGVYENQAQWIMEVDSLAPISRNINYYDVQVYDYYIDTATNVCSLYTYPMVASSNIENSFTINGDVSEVFGGLNGASQFTVTGSTSNPTNNGTYTVNAATYNTTTQQTVITVVGTVPSNIFGGLIAPINFRTIPWTTGTLVAPNATQLMPLPLQSQSQYFIIVLSPTTFQLAYNMADVTAAIPIAFTSPAYGIQTIGLPINTFTALGGQTTTAVWTHYAIDTTRIKQFTTPYTLSGMQNWVNILDGYISYIQAQGFAFNVTGAYLDPQTGAQVSWQNEIERFINWSYLQRSVRKQRQNDKYAVAANYTNSQLTYTSQNPNFVTGTQIIVWAFNGGLPSPLINGMIYYVINKGTYIQFASTPSNAQSGVAITLTPSITVGQLYISQASIYLAELPTYELNAFRNALWYSPPEGIVTNLLQGPYTDISSQQLLFDQYGRKLTPSDIRVFRQDKQTEIQFASGVYNDQVAFTQANPYLNLHLGGGNIFIDTYEHVIIFNDYTVGGALIYDPFLGVNSTKFELSYYKQTPFTERPNVGGYFLSTNYNQGANIDRNLESSVEDIRYMYNVYEVPETLPIIARGRALVDYPGAVSYLQAINLTPKSQFLFWLASIHAKGSVNAVEAFVNSRRFVSANVDQFWAYQVAQFGSSSEQEYLSMLLQITDTQTNDLRLEFVRSDEVCLPGYAVNTFGDENCGYANPQSGTDVQYNTDATFIPIATNDSTRWYNQPDQAASLTQDGGTLYFSLKPKQKLTIYPVVIGPTTFIPYGPSVITDPTSPLYPANLSNEVAVIAYSATPTTSMQPGQQFSYTFWYWNTSGGGYWTFGGGWSGTELPIFRNNFMADLTELMFTLHPAGYEFTQTIPTVPAGVKEWTIPPYIPLTNSLQVFQNGIQLTSGVDYVESLEPYTYPSSVVSNLLSYKLYFLDSISGTTLTVVYGASTLNSQLQVETINTNIVQLNSQEIISNFMFTNNVPNPLVTMSMWGFETDKETQNPAKIIDELAEVVLSPVTFWDPARGYQYYQALHSIDIQTNVDPAIYDAYHGWKNIEVGKTWLDTTNLQYLPYYDPYTITDQETRFTDWGQLTDFGAVNIYQWVASPVTPADYNALAAQQQNDSTIPESIRLSGTVRQDVRFRNRANTTAVIQEATSGTTTVVLSTSVVPTDLTGLAVNSVSSTDILYNLTVVVDGKSRTIEIFGSDLSTFGTMITAINAQLVQVGATATLIGDSVVITSLSTGTTSSVVIDQSSTTMFQAWNNGASTPVSIFAGFSTPVVGTAGSATSGHQAVNLTAGVVTANTPLALGYVAAVTPQDVEYSLTIGTVGANVSGFINNNQQPWFSTNETRMALGSQLSTFNDVKKFLSTFTNVNALIGGSSITITSLVPASSSEPTIYPSLVSLPDDSFLFHLPGWTTITNIPGTTTGSFGQIVINFPSGIVLGDLTGLAPVNVPAVDPVYSFNIDINNNVNRTVTISASQALTYGDLVSAIGSQISSVGGGVQLNANQLIFTSDTSGTSSTVALTSGTLIPAIGTIQPAVAGTASTATSGYQYSNATIPLYNGLTTGLAPSSIAVPQGYSFEIVVDNTITRTVSVKPTQVATYAALISTLTPIIAVYGATIALNSTGTALLIQSNTTGASSFLAINLDTLFSSITTNNGGQASYVSGVNLASQSTLFGTNQTITVASTVGFVIGSTVLFSTTGTLPTGIAASTLYTITNIAGNVISINTTVTSPSTGTVTMANSVWSNNWSLDQQQQANLDPLVDATAIAIGTQIYQYTFALADITDPTQEYAVELFPVGSVVNVYVNGKTLQTGYTVTSTGFVFPSTNIVGTTTYTWPTLVSSDRVTIILPKHVPTATELAFDPAVADDGTVQTQWQYITNYNAVQTVDTTTNQNVFTYYFWVANVTTATGTRESPVDSAIEILTPPAPYMFFNKLVAPQVITNTQNGQAITVPYRFTQAIVRGLRGYVDQNNRYVLRFTRDFTLRDNLAFGTSPLQLKDTHQEWMMFRQAQLSTIPRGLWDRITSAIVGYDITSTATPQPRVPALDRELYDSQYNTSTQYGLGTGQAFVNGALAQSTILAYLNDPTNNFYPIDLDQFFDTYDFNTNADIIAAMNAIYTSFSYNNVNNMFFSVLQDALTTQTQYAGLMKTSAIALYGVELLDVNGVFDD